MHTMIQTHINKYLRTYLHTLMYADTLVNIHTHIYEYVCTKALRVAKLFYPYPTRKQKFLPVPDPYP